MAYRRDSEKQVTTGSDLNFRPHPLARNPHFQTIVSSLYRRQETRLHQVVREMILEVGEGVRLQGYYSPQPKGQGKGLVLLLHGWLGHANASYVITTGEYLYQRGYSIFRLNFRDHGDTHHLNPGLFRGDLLAEAFAATQRIAELERDRPLHIVGTSLGGNFALRLAWRHSQTPLPNLAHTVAICPPLNPYHSTLALDTGPLVYLAYFRHKWRKSMRRKKAAFPPLYDFSDMLAARTCLAMTEAFVRYSPHPNARAYFDSYAVTPEMMTTLCSPVTVMTAADDPVVPVADFYAFRDLSPYLQVHIQAYGGHVGFIDLFPFRYWVNEVILTILESQG